MTEFFIQPHLAGTSKTIIILTAINLKEKSLRAL